MGCFRASEGRRLEDQASSLSGTAPCIASVMRKIEPLTCDNDTRSLSYTFFELQCTATARTKSKSDNRCKSNDDGHDGNRGGGQAHQAEPLLTVLSVLRAEALRGLHTAVLERQRLVSSVRLRWLRLRHHSIDMTGAGLLVSKGRIHLA